MTYKQTLDYLYAKLPMFTRIGAAALKNDLHNTLAFCEHLGNPERKFKSIHVGGTNGKGSTSHMLAAVLQEAGYKTGLYTSPHLKDFRERIKINGEMITHEEVVSFVRHQQGFITDLSPSFFEVTVGLAFQHFAKHEVDIAVIEVGLGGRLDSTNVISPEVSVITNIGFDHVDILGDTLEKIALEKAGIIKRKTPVVIGEYQEATAPVFEAKASQEQAEIIFASKQWCNGESQLINGKRNLTVHGLYRSLDLQLDLTGNYQLKNVKTVLSAVDELIKKGFEISDQHIVNALGNVKESTGLLGRWQILSENPLVICDTGHNEDGIKEVLQNIKSTPHKNLHMVIGMVKDKDISRVLSLLPKDAVYYFCEPNLERAKPVQDLQKEAAFFGLVGEAYESVPSALFKAKTNASSDDLIFVGGSTFVVAEVV